MRIALWADKGIWVSGPATLELDGGVLTADIMLDARAKPRASASISARTTAPEAIFLAAGTDTLPLPGRVDLGLEIYGTGYSLGEMVAGAQGQINLLASAGLPASAAVNWVPSSVAYGTDSRLAFDVDVDVDVDVDADAASAPQDGLSLGASCLVSRVDIEAGVARSEVFLVDTERATTAGSGEIDLATERIALHLRPRPKDPAELSSARDLRVEGPLLRPRVQASPPDRRGLARATGAVSLLRGPDALMPLLGAEAVLANPCMRDAMGETAIASAELPAQGTAP